MRVKNMVSKNGNFVPNQFVIWDEDKVYFQSYRSIIAKIEDGKTYLDENFWNYSRTTSKYRNDFLRLTTDETKAKIKSGEFVLTDLNQELTT